MPPPDQWNGEKERERERERGDTAFVFNQFNVYVLTICRSERRLLLCLFSINVADREQETEGGRRRSVSLLVKIVSGSLDGLEWCITVNCTVQFLLWLVDQLFHYSCTQRETEGQ